MSALIKRADLAMHDAKSSGTGFRLYESTLATSDPQRLALLANSVVRSSWDSWTSSCNPRPFQFGVVIGVEALVGWHHSTYHQTSSFRLQSAAA